MDATWPPAVLPGARVGVAALSGAVEPDPLRRGLEGLRALGYVPVLARNVASRYGPLAGSDDERLNAFHELVADDSLAAILFARGGYGLLRVLPRLDWSLLGRRPRAWVGYSDLTPLLLQITQRLGLVTFHGPMVATDLARGLSDEEARSLRAALAAEGPFAFPLRWARPGAAEGVVLGGCLSLLAATLGTPWSPRLDDALLFLEDINEPLYRVDRMLTHLRGSGTLSSVRAIVAGHFGAEWERAIGGGDSSARWHHETFLQLPGPLAFGLPCGHGTPNLTLPLGARGQLEAAPRLLRIG